MLQKLLGNRGLERFEFTAKSPAEAAYANLRFGEVFQISGKCYVSEVCVDEVESGESLENRVAAIPFLNQNPVLDDSVFESDVWKNAAHLGDFLVPPAGTKTLIRQKSDFSTMIQRLGVFQVGRRQHY